MSESTTVTPVAPLVLRWSAIVAAVGTIIQFALGLVVLQGWAVDLIRVHEGIGYVTTLAAVVAAVAAVLWKRAGGPTGVMAHAISMPVLMVIQIGLAEMHLRWVHVVFGLIILVGAVALMFMVSKDPNEQR